MHDQWDIRFSQHSVRFVGSHHDAVTFAEHCRPWSKFLGIFPLLDASHPAHPTFLDSGSRQATSTANPLAEESIPGKLSKPWSPRTLPT